ncbi:hypothetical protein VZT92_012234 [Zoarces viviparus]|uniref:Uncharacterized protein n=1 Tax=Zoarces viviparus TaxID=48416 RepID=A0AAW1F813_ZOAVI
MQCICSAIDLSSERNGLPFESNTFSNCSVNGGDHALPATVRKERSYLCLTCDPNGKQQRKQSSETVVPTSEP